MRFGRVVFSFLLAVSAFGQTARKVDFSSDVQPILKKRCEACHGAAQQISGFRLDQREGAMAGGYSGPVIVPGKSAESKLIQRVSGAPGVMVMPPSGTKLTPEEIGVLRAWIDSGANWSPTVPSAAQAQAKSRHPHWAFQPITLPQAPQAANAKWIRNPVDAFVLSRLERENIHPAPEADKRTMLRRVSIDLDRLASHSGRTEGFHQRSTRGRVRTGRGSFALVTALRRDAGLVRGWTALGMRTATGTKRTGSRPFAWRYRQWVIDALNRDMPFDKFTIEQVAGDLLPERQRQRPHRDWLPPANPHESRGRYRQQSVPVRGRPRSREHSRSQPGWDSRWAARSATTTSTIRSARKIITSSSRSSRTSRKPISTRLCPARSDRM